MIKITLTTYLILIVCTLSAQPIHELKTGLQLPIKKGLNCSYEFIPAGKLGVEFGLRYQWAVRSYAFNRLPNFQTNGESVETKALTLTITGKWYGPKAYNGDRFYGGAYLRQDWLLNGSGIFNQYENLRVFEPYNTLYFKKIEDRSLRVALGLLIGYKKVISRHWLVEINCGVEIQPLRRNTAYF